MAKEPQVFGFGADDIKRIGSAVRIVERGPTMQVQPQMDSASVRQFPIFLGTAGSAAWTKQTSKTVTIYSGTPHTVTGLPPSSAMTLTAFNIFADISSIENLVLLIKGIFSLRYKFSTSRNSILQLTEGSCTRTSGILSEELINLATPSISADKAFPLEITLTLLICLLP